MAEPMTDPVKQNSLGILRKLRGMAETAEERPFMADVPWRGPVYPTPAFQTLAESGYYDTHDTNDREAWLAAIDRAIKSLEESDE